MPRRRRVAVVPSVKPDASVGTDDKKIKATPLGVETNTTDSHSVPAFLPSTEWTRVLDQYCLDTFPLFSKFNAGSGTVHNPELDREFEYKYYRSYTDPHLSEDKWPLGGGAMCCALELIGHVHYPSEYPEHKKPDTNTSEAMDNRVKRFEPYILFDGPDFDLDLPSTMTTQHQWKYQALYTIMSYKDLIAKNYAEFYWDNWAIAFLEELLDHGDPIGVFGSVPDAELTGNRAKWREAFKKTAPWLLKMARDFRFNKLWHGERQKRFREKVTTAADIKPTPASSPEEVSTQAGKRATKRRKLA